MVHSATSDIAGENPGLYKDYTGSNLELNLSTLRYN